MRISDWSSDVCASDLMEIAVAHMAEEGDLSVRPTVFEHCRHRRDIVLHLPHRERSVEGIEGLELPNDMIEILADFPYMLALDFLPGGDVVVEERSEQRRVGTECVSTCRDRVEA